MNTEKERGLQSGFSYLEETVFDAAHFRAVFDRDGTDSFSLEITPLDDAVDSRNLPEKSDLLPMLPRGSDWVRARGWRSFFGIPCRIKGSLFLGLGLMKVLPHSSRGAYPRQTIYFLRFDDGAVSDCLGNLSRWLGNSNDTGQLSVDSYGAVIGDAAGPGDHLETESLIINRAEVGYRKGDRLLFRTAVLSEQEVPPFSYLRMLWGDPHGDGNVITFNRILYGVVPPVWNSFAWQSKLKILLEQRVMF